MTKLGDLIEDIDIVFIAARACSTKSELDEVIAFAQEDVAPRLCFNRLQNEFKNQQGETKAISKYRNQTPMTYLRMQI